MRAWVIPRAARTLGIVCLATMGTTSARANDCGGLEFLSDACGKKVMPSNRARDWMCPNVATSETIATADGARPIKYVASEAPVEVDASALRAIVPEELRVTLILVRRVNGRPLYRYLSNGTHAIAEQPWSSTKFMAVANGARALRAASNHGAGLDSSVRGIPLGDLVTTIHNYDERRFTSNGLARYFHDIGHRDKANELVHVWLGRPESESYGGNYGMPSPDLGYRFRGPDGTEFSIRSQRGSGPPNHLSTLTMAEFLKRLVMHREDAATRLPELEWSDLRVLFYGAENSAIYPGRLGGMSADPAIYIQSAVDIQKMEEISHGQFRIFSKLGFGDGQFVENQYACFPVLGEKGRAVSDRGTEMILSTRLASGRRSWRETDALLAKYTRAIVTGVMAGAIQ